LYRRWQSRKSRSIVTRPVRPTADKIKINFGVKNVSIARSFISMFSVSSESVTFSGNKTFYYSKVLASQILHNFTGTKHVGLAVMLYTCSQEILGLNIGQDLNYPL
jgi:hypothetical protein